MRTWHVPSFTALLLAGALSFSAHASQSAQQPTVEAAFSPGRGVDVRIVADHKHNQSKSGQVALNLVVNAGIPARTVAAYGIHHDKFIIAAGKTVQTGSFNYSASAAKANSENVLVIWNNPALTVAYMQHWQLWWDKEVAWQSTY